MNELASSGIRSFGEYVEAGRGGVNHSVGGTLSGAIEYHPEVGVTQGEGGGAENPTLKPRYLPMLSFGEIWGKADGALVIF